MNKVKHLHNNPVITIPTVYSNNPEKGVDRITIDGMNQQDIRDNYRNMIRVLFEFVYKYEHGNGDSGFVDKSLGPTCVYAREVLKESGFDINKI